MLTIAGTERALFLGQMTHEQIETVQHRMYPGRLQDGRWSSVGFLKEGDSLKEVIACSDHLVTSSSFSHEQIADQLQLVMKKASTISQKVIRWQTGNYLPVLQGKYVVQQIHSERVQLCPFSLDEKKDCGGHSGSSDFIVTNFETGDTFSFSSLMEHLIRAHHFFESSEYALDPREMIAFFHLQKSSPPCLQFEKKTIWEDTKQIPRRDGMTLRHAWAKKQPSQHFDLALGVEAFWMENKELLYVINTGEEALDLVDKPQQLGNAWLDIKLFPGDYLFKPEEEELIILDKSDTITEVRMAIINPKGDAILIDHFSI